MEKKIMVRDSIHSVKYDNMNADILFCHLTARGELLPTDIIDIQREENYDNNSWDSYTVLQVYREREETDEEFEKRMRTNTNTKKYLKERRYKTYLKFKEEFENGVEPEDDEKPAVSIKFPKFCRWCGGLINNCNCEDAHN